MTTVVKRALRAGIIAVGASLLALGTSFSTGAAAFADDLTFTSTPTVTVTPTTPVSVGDELTKHVTGTWSVRPTSITYSWYRNGVEIDGGLDEESYQITSDDVGAQITFEEVATLAGYTDGVAASNAVVPLPRASIAGVTVSTTSPKAGVAITASYTSTVPADASVSYQWSQYAGGQLVPMGTGPSYTPSESDDNIPLELIVTATAPGYGPYETGRELGPVTPSILHPEDVAILAIPVVGVPTPINNAWSPAASSYSNIQWSVNGKAIAGATGITFTPTASDVGKHLTVTETANLDGYAPVTYTTAASAEVEKNFTKIPTPTITGTAAIGSTLTAHTAKWTPAATSYTYQWQVDGNNVDSSGPTFTPAYDQWAGKTVTVIVTGVSGGQYGPSASHASAPTAPLADGQVQAGTVTLTATGINDEATATPKGWADGANLTYAWTVNGVASAPSGFPTHLIADDPSLVGKSVSVTVTDTEAGQSPVSATASAVISVGSYRYTGIGLPVIGTVAVGQTLTLDESAWSPTPDAVSVRWYEVAGTGPRLLSTKPSFTIPSKYDAKQIYAVVKASGTALLSASTETYVHTVAAGTFATQPVPTVTGKLTVGSTLTAHHGTWSPSSGDVYKYAWFEQAGDDAPVVAISKATHSTLKLTKAMLGDTITVQVTAHHLYYLNASKTSLPTSVVAQ